MFFGCLQSIFGDFYVILGGFCGTFIEKSHFFDGNPGKNVQILQKSGLNSTRIEKTGAAKLFLNLTIEIENI